MSMSYLQQILKETGGTESRNRRRRTNITAMLTQPDAPTVAAATAAPGKKPAGPHSMGDGHNHGSQGEVNGLNAQFQANLNRLISDAPGKVTIGSGYRSIAEQAKLYDRWIRKVPGQAQAAKPGSSNHNFGLAADLVYADAKTRQWVHANAARYGMRFPMSFEPWHIEPIGAKALRGKK